MRPGPLRGRSEPMSRALSVVRDAQRHGSGSLVLLSGPAGIGKTALVNEVCHQAAIAKLRVLRSKCDQIEQVWPGAPVLALFRSGRGLLIDVSEYEQITRMISEPIVLAERLAAILQRLVQDGPLVIAIDDVHWADRVSRLLMRTLVARSADLPVVWLLASRDTTFEGQFLGQEPRRIEYLRLGRLGS